MQFIWQSVGEPARRLRFLSCGGGLSFVILLHRKPLMTIERGFNKHHRVVMDHKRDASVWTVSQIIGEDAVNWSDLCPGL